MIVAALLLPDRYPSVHGIGIWVFDNAIGVMTEDGDLGWWPLVADLVPVDAVCYEIGGPIVPLPDLPSQQLRSPIEGQDGSNSTGAAVTIA